MSVAQTFVRARHSGEIVSVYPGVSPSSLDEAYRIQEAAIELTQRPIGGWKVGRIANPLVGRFGADRIAGPIFANAILQSDGQLAEVPVLPGFAAVEAELLFRLGNDITGPVSIQAAPDYVTEVRLGIEIASSPFPGINDHGPGVTASDFANNFGLVVGPVVQGWRSPDLLRQVAEMHIDGELVGRGAAADMLDGPFGALAFLSHALLARGRKLSAGAWISTGALTGVHRIMPGQQARASMGGLSVACRAYAYAGWDA